MELSKREKALTLTFPPARRAITLVHVTQVLTPNKCAENFSVAGQCRSDPHAFSWCVTGADLMEEHLREIRSLHRRLEDSIQTNERLRQQLAERLGSRVQDGGLRISLTLSTCLSTF